MRTVATFSVTGGNKAELAERARQAYRQLSGDPRAELPRQTTMDITVAQEERSVDGETLSRLWEADVTVSVPFEGDEP